MPAKRFIFRLETVLQVKLRKEDEEKKKLADLIAWQREEERILAEMVYREQNTRASLKEKQATGQWIEVDELKRIANFLKKIAKDIEMQKEKLQEIERRIEEQRLALLQAVQERKTLEMLKEQQHEEWRAEVEAEEAKFLDELATLKYAREGYGNED